MMGETTVVLMVGYLADPTASSMVAHSAGSSAECWVASMVETMVETMDARSAARLAVYSAGYWEDQLVAHSAEYLAALKDALSATRNLKL